MVAEFRVVHVSYEDLGKGGKPMGVSVRLMNLRKGTNGWSDRKMFSDMPHEDIPAGCTLKSDVGD